MVGGFFSLLIGYIVFLLMNYKEGSKIWKQEGKECNRSKEYAINHNKPVWFYGYYKNEKIYIETKSNRKVFKGIDKNGLKRWYYTDTKRPMEYTEDKILINNIKQNKAVALAEGKDCFVAEHFWDDTIINTEDKEILPVTYLDDFGFSNYSSQRIYLKNMRPYQLYIIGISEYEFRPFAKKQYLIRFGEPWYFNLKTQHCFFDKRLSSKNKFWSKWYAATEEDYLKLSNPISLKYKRTEFKAPSCLITYGIKSINMEDIAFKKGIKKPEWDLDNCGIIKAFDEDGNFVGD